MVQTSEIVEILFYHLQQRTVDAILPNLIARSLERDWRVVLRAQEQTRLDSLSHLLWTYQEDSFLPHGTAQDLYPEQQPIYLTTGMETPNQADIQILIDDGAYDLFAFKRTVLLFSEIEPNALNAARNSWRSLKGSQAKATYWKQNEDSGVWEKYAEMIPKS